jgi:hypothetical protein
MCTMCPRCNIERPTFSRLGLCNAHFRHNLRKNRRQVSVALMGVVHIRGAGVDQEPHLALR